MSKSKKNGILGLILDLLYKYDLQFAIIVFVFSLIAIWILFLAVENPPSLFSWLENLTWERLGAITSAFTFALVASGVIFTILDRKQKEEADLREKQQLSYEHFRNINEHLTSTEQEEARRWIYINIPIKTEDLPLNEWLDVVKKAINHKPKGWTEPRTPGQKYLKMVLNDFDYIGFIFKNFWEIQPELEKAYIGWLSPPVAKVWERIGPYVKAQRTERNEKDYYEAAGAIGDYAIEWRKKNGYSESEIIKDTI